MRYFKKLIPKTPVVISGGKVIFDTIDDLTGYHKTGNAYVIEQFVGLIKKSVGGISEISEAEYERDFAEKKRSGINLRPTWERESFGGKSSRPISPHRASGVNAVLAAVAVKEPQVSMEGDAVRQQIVTPPKPKQDDKPPVTPTGKRPKREQ